MRMAAGVSALLAVWVAVCSPLSTWHHTSLTAHMTQHLLLTLAAPLALLAIPRASRVHRRLAWINQPVLGWFAGSGVVVGWHVPSAFALTMSSPFWHGVQQGTFVISGLLFWLPIVQPRYAPESGASFLLPLYLFAATLPCDALAAFLAFNDRIVYAAYRADTPALHAAALRDQATAGAVMWMVVTFAYLVPAVVHVMSAVSPCSTDNQLPAASPLATPSLDADRHLPATSRHTTT